MFSTMKSLFVAFISIGAMACSDAPLSGSDLVTGKWTTVNPKSATKATVVAFLSAKCPCSKSHEKTLNELSKEFSEFNFVAVHSNSDEPALSSAEYFKSAGLLFPVLQDKDSQIANAFGALKTPHVFIVSPSGECLYNGGVDDSKSSGNAKKRYLKNALIDLREGRTPSEKTTRTLGCIIQRS